MADADSSIEILIKSVLDATGYRMNEAEAAKLKGTLGDTTKATEHLSEANEEGAKSAEKLHVNHRALHQILHLIGHESGPAAGAAIAGLAAAGTGSMIIAVMAVRELIGGIAELRKESEEAKKSLEGIGIAARDAQTAADELYAAIIRQQAEERDSAEAVTAAYERQKTSLEAQLKAHEKILEAMEKEELAAAKGDKAKEEEIKMRYEQEKADYGDAGAAAKIRLEEQYLEKLKASRPDLELSERMLAADIASKTANPATPYNFKIDPDKEAGLKLAAKEAEEFLQRVLTNTTTPLERVKGYDPHTAAVDAREAKEKLDQYEKNRQALEDYNANLAAEKEELGRATEARKKNADAIQSHTESVANERTKFAGQISGEQITKGIDIANRAGAGGKVTPQESDFLIGLDRMMEGHNVSLVQAEKRLQAMGRNPQLLDNFLNRLMTQVENMSPLNLSALEARLKALESRHDRPTQ